MTGSMNSGSFFTDLISNDGTYPDDYDADHSDLPEMSNGFSCPVDHPDDTQPPHEQPSRFT
jgi:hypothetical protein